MHKLLQRQIRRHLPGGVAIPSGMEALFAAISDAYAGADSDRALAERSLDLVSEELLERNQQLNRELVETRIAEELAARRERNFRLLIDVCPDAIALRRGAEIVYANSAWAAMLGYESAVQCVGLPMIESFAPRERAEVLTLMRELDRMGRLERPRLVIREMLRCDGTPAWFEFAIPRVVEFAQGEAVLVAGRDVTERLRTEAETRRLERRLELADRMASIGTLASGIAHEINTPIQFVMDSVVFAQESVGDLLDLIQVYRAGSHDSRAIAEAEESADLAYLVDHLPEALVRSIEGLSRVAAIVRSMKELAHPGRKEMTPVDLNRLIETTLTISRTEYRYVADVIRELGEIPRVVCHAGDISQALLNLVVNASHAIADAVRGTARRGEIRIRTRHEGEDVVVEIADTGVGIPAAIRDRIFDPFFTTKEVGTGTGQGLSLARTAIQDRHGGMLNFDSVEGVGTTFRIRLPVAGKAAESEAA